MKRNRVGRLPLGLFFLFALSFASRAIAQEQPPAAPEPAIGDATAEEAIEDAAPGPAPDAPTLSLGAAVTLALERNYSLLGQADNVAAAGFRVGVARAEFLPRITPRFSRGSDGTTFGFDGTQLVPWTGGSIEASTAFASNPASTTPVSRTASAQVLIRQPLLRGAGPNATFYDLANARRARQTQERELALGRQRLAVQATAAYYNVIAQRQLLGVARQSLKRSRTLLLASEARLKVGLASKLDVFRAQLQAAQTEDAMVRSQAALETALEQLRAFLALSPHDAVEPEAIALAEAATDELPPLEALVAQALERRLELQEARDVVSDGQRTLSLMKQNLLPQLDATVTVSRVGGGPSFGDAWSTGDTRTTVGFSTYYPLERSADRANLAVAELDLAARERALRQREQDVESEVRAAVREIVRIRKSVDLQRQAVEVAAQQRRLATLRYERGLASNFDVVDAEGSLLLARSALVGLLASYKVAEVELKRATGTLDVTRDFAA